MLVFLNVWLCQIYAKLFQPLNLCDFKYYMLILIMALKMDIIQRIRVRNKLMFYLILENDLYFFEITEELCAKYRSHYTMETETRLW